MLHTDNDEASHRDACCGAVGFGTGLQLFRNKLDESQRRYATVKPKDQCCILYRINEATSFYHFTKPNYHRATMDFEAMPASTPA